MALTEQHQTYLTSHAVPTEAAERAGVRSITGRGQLPPELEWAEQFGPGILFTWTTPSGVTVPQYRPDKPPADADGRPKKYLFPEGSGSNIGVVREADPDGPVIFAEGSKQALACGAYAPADHSVYFIAGCRGWSTDGVPEADLELVDGREVLVIFDADLETNLDVWLAAEKFGRALKAEGATKVRYVLSTAGAKAGLDDVLAKRSEDRRALVLGRLLEQAKDRLPKKPARKKADGIAGTEDRPLIDVGGDRLAVVDAITEAIKKRYDGRSVFNYGGIIAWRDGAGLEPVVGGRFNDLVASCATTASQRNGDYLAAWPESATLSAAASRAREYTLLEQITQVPFLRPDGSICQEDGYDAASQTYLVLDEDMRVDVPEVPSDDDVAQAVKLLADEWLGDLMKIMPTPADRANVLALVLTPLVRRLISVAPLAVVDGLQMSVGKNLLADVLSIFSTGRVAEPLPLPRDDEEVRKLVTSAFLSGSSLFVFDEAHTIEGTSLARALTAHRYTDRKLGVSAMVGFPNRITWLALGNNVRVNGDVSRRAYRIRLAPTTANPQDRSADEFRHPDLRGWTAEHRAELVQAGLTILRAWALAGRPLSPEGRKFGSFEEWGGIVGGALENAGVGGFLENRVEWRSETDTENTGWIDHLAWLYEQSKGKEFKVNDVRAYARRSGDDAMLPPRLDDPTVPRWTSALGEAYKRHAGRIYGGWQLILAQRLTGHANRWQVIRHDGGGDQGKVSPEGDHSAHTGGNSTPEPGIGDSGDSGYSALPEARVSDTSVSIMSETHAHVGEGGGLSRQSRQSSQYPLRAFGVLLEALPTVPAPVCSTCGEPEALVPVADAALWYACKMCSPDSFATDGTTDERA